MIPGHRAAGGPGQPAEAAANLRPIQLGLLLPALIELRILLGLFPPVGTSREPNISRTIRPSSMPPEMSTRRYWKSGKKATFEPITQNKGISQ